MRARLLTSSVVVCLAGVLLAPVAAVAAAPTATIVVADTALKAGETSEVTITFSEAVTDFTLADLRAENGILSGLSTANNIVWAATLTPNGSTTDATNVITLDNTGVTNGGGEPGVATTDSNNYAIDTARPTATIVVGDPLLNAGETAPVTITFSEAVTGFTLADLTAENGALSALTTSDTTTFTAMLTPAAVNDSTNVITLNNTGVTDGAGNPGAGTTTSNSYAVDTTYAAATIAVADTSLRVGETSLVTITFREAATGFDKSDLVLPPSGSLSAVSTTDNLTWTATLTPTASTTAASNVISLDLAKVNFPAGAGAGTVTSKNYAVDTVRPTATIAVTDTALRIGETSLVTITFSEPVTGFTNADLTVPSGGLSLVSTSNGGTTWSATLTPAVAVTDSTNVISLSLTGVTDVAGNQGVGTAASTNYAVDTVRPAATITLADGALKAGETTLVTITFNEPVTGFANADLTVPSATLSPVATTNGGTTWTATLTAAPGITDAVNAISLNLTGVTDAAGNPGTGAAVSGNYVVDAFAPTSSASGPALTSNRTWSIGYETDDDSTVAAVALFVRAPGQSTYAAVGSDTANQDGTFSYTGSAEGSYSFYTVATDAAGNVEPAPASPDVTTVLDTTSPVLVARMGRTPVRFDLSKDSVLPLRVRVNERSAVSLRIVNSRGATVRTFGVKRDVAGLVTQEWNGRRSGRLVAEGKYRLLAVAQDLAGNLDRVTVLIRVTR